jgi:hypothetical protein
MDDSRESSTIIDRSVVVDSADQAGLVEIIRLVEGNTFVLDEIQLQYKNGATVSNVGIEVIDADEGSAIGDTSLSDAQWFREIDPGTSLRHDDLVREEFEESVTVAVDRDGAGIDGDLFINISGFLE